MQFSRSGIVPSLALIHDDTHIYTQRLSQTRSPLTVYILAARGNTNCGSALQKKKIPQFVPPTSCVSLLCVSAVRTGFTSAIWTLLICPPQPPTPPTPPPLIISNLLHGQASLSLLLQPCPRSWSETLAGGGRTRPALPRLRGAREGFKGA